MTLRTLLCLLVVWASLPAMAAPIEGILFVPKVFAELAEADPAHYSIRIPVYQQPSKTSPVVATVSRQGIQDPAGKFYHVPEFRYEEKALPILERRGEWYKVGLSSESVDGFPDVFALTGWLSFADAEFEPLVEFLKKSMVSVIDWDHTLYKTPGSKDKTAVNIPELKFLGMAALRLEILNKTSAGTCQIPFFKSADRQSLIGICPQNFSVIHGKQCFSSEEIVRHPGPAAFFCRKVYVLEQRNGLYRIALKNEFERLQGATASPPEKDPSFPFLSAWVDAASFEKLAPLSPDEVASAKQELGGESQPPHKDVQIQETKKVEGADWVRVKVIDHCGEEKVYGEGWLPVLQGQKINFTFVPRGC